MLSNLSYERWLNEPEDARKYFEGRLTANYREMQIGLIEDKLIASGFFCVTAPDMQSPRPLQNSEFLARIRSDVGRLPGRTSSDELDEIHIS